MRVHVKFMSSSGSSQCKVRAEFECMLTLKILLVFGLCLRYFPVLAREKKSLEFGLECELKIELDFQLDFELVFKRQIVVSVV